MNQLDKVPAALVAIPHRVEHGVIVVAEHLSRFIDENADWIIENQQLLFSLAGINIFFSMVLLVFFKDVSSYLSRKDLEAFTKEVVNNDNFAEVRENFEKLLDKVMRREQLLRLLIFALITTSIALPVIIRLAHEAASAP